MSQTIKPESSVSLLIMGAVVVAIFTIFTTVEPSFKQIEVNASQITTNAGDIEVIQSTQREYIKYMIKITSALSRIEGRLDATISQGRRLDATISQGRNR